MQKKWIYYGLATLMAATALSLALFKNNDRKPVQKTDKQLIEVLVNKIDSLYADEQQLFLRANLTKDELAAVQDEFERILIGRDLAFDQLNSSDKKNSEWQEPKEKLAILQKKSLTQDQVNQFFLPKDYRTLTGSQQDTKHAIVTADDLFNEEGQTTATSNSETSSSTTPSKKKEKAAATKKESELLSLNGTVVNAFLVIDDTVVTDDFATIKKEIEKEGEPNDWQKALLTIIDNGLAQLETLEKAQKLVAELYEGEAVKPDISKKQYEDALTEVEKIYNSTRQQPLLDKMEKVAQAIGEEFSQKDYLFEELSDRSAITLTATQTNSEWQAGPISFSIKIVNDSERNISFAYHRFAIQKPNKTLNLPDFDQSVKTERFVVKKGQEFTLADVPFKYPNETIVKSSKNSQFVYLLDKENVTDPKVLLLTNVTFTEKPIDTSTSTSKPDTSKERLTAVRKMLKELNVDDSLISDAELKGLIIKANEDNLNDTNLLILICKHLGLDYHAIVNKEEVTTSSSTETEE